MIFKFVLKRGRYSCSSLYCNGFRIGTLSWSMTRNDPKPHVVSLSICDREWTEHFEKDDEAKAAAMAKCKEWIRELCGEVTLNGSEEQTKNSLEDHKESSVREG